MMIDRDLQLREAISNNIKRLVAEKNWNQVNLSFYSGIPKSTISDYVNAKTLINQSNVNKLSLAFNVPKSTIDPSFNNKLVSNITITDKDISILKSLNVNLLLYAEEENEKEDNLQLQINTLNKTILFLESVSVD